jgi:hypothetical protein
MTTSTVDGSVPDRPAFAREPDAADLERGAAAGEARDLDEGAFGLGRDIGG